MEFAKLSKSDDRYMRHLVRLNFETNSVDLIEPITPGDIDAAAILATRLGNKDTSPIAAKPFRECIDAYMNERAVTDKSRGEALSILVEYDTWCRSAGHDPWAMVSARDYKAEYLQKPDPEGTLLHPKTINKHLTRLSSLFKWCLRHDYTTRNTFEGMKVPLPKRKASEERPILTHAEVEILLSHLDPIADARCWWPLIALYSGARPTEIAQLYHSDVITVDGVLCLSINDSQPGQRLKNVQSKRLIPVHEELLRRGFSEWVKTSGMRLFPRWSMGSRNGAWHAGNDWYRRLRDRIGLEKDAYCIRHTVLTCLRDLRQPSDLLAELAGHMRHGITLSRYSKDSPVLTLQPVVNSLPVNPGRKG
jgi:hypothetical protein